jgi:hypothetical protein
MRPLPAKAWTLRLKRGRRTVLLFADPSAPLLHVKQSLLAALRAVPTRGDDDGEDDGGAAPEPLPASTADVELARPVDVFDVTAGFEMVGAPSPAAGGDSTAESGEGEANSDHEEENEDRGEEVKRDEQEEGGAGRAARAAARGRRASAGQATEDDKSLTSLGIKENAVLVYRFRGGEAEKERRGKDPGWSIEVPSFEDPYGVENEGDLGVKPEFRG